MKSKSTRWKSLAGTVLLASGLVLTGCPAGGGTVGNNEPPVVTKPGGKLSMKGGKVLLTPNTGAADSLALGRSTVAMITFDKGGVPKLEHGRYSLAKAWDRLKASGRFMNLGSRGAVATLEGTPPKLVIVNTAFSLSEEQSNPIPVGGKADVTFELEKAEFLAVVENQGEMAVIACCDAPCEPMDVATLTTRVLKEQPSPIDVCVPRKESDGNEIVIVLECNITDPDLTGRLEQLYPGLGALIYPGDEVAAKAPVPFTALLPWDDLTVGGARGLSGGKEVPVPVPNRMAARMAADVWAGECVLSESEYAVTVCGNTLIVKSVSDGSTTEIDMAGCKVGLSLRDRAVVVRYDDKCKEKMSRLPCGNR